MRASKFTDSQILAILKEYEIRADRKRIVWKIRFPLPNLALLEKKIGGIITYFKYS